MKVIVTEIIRQGEVLYFTATCGKTSALVCVGGYDFLRVICQNSSHRVWRGAGRRFDSIDEALTSYRSTEMRRIITAALAESDRPFLAAA